RCEDGASDPYGVFPLRRSNDLDLHGAGSKSSDLLLHPVGDTRVHGGTSGENVVGVEILADVDIALHDGVVGGFVDSSGFHSYERRLEERFWASKSLISDRNDLT
uniref:Uncharacterized protein n=1 Tax=Ciona savignyi TaxID=51511 RepID=H2ZAT4_CIOSA